MVSGQGGNDLPEKIVGPEEKIGGGESEGGHGMVAPDGEDGMHLYMNVWWAFKKNRDLSPFF